MKTAEYYRSYEYKQAVFRARAMSPEEKFFEVPRLFEIECEQIWMEIRKQFPSYSEEEVKHCLRLRLDQQREEEERGIYIKMPIGWKPS